MFALSAAEVAFWGGYYRRHGFPTDRLEWVAANGAAYVGATHGGKAKPAALIPVFERRQQPAEVVKAWFDSLAPGKGGSDGG